MKIPLIMSMLLTVVVVVAQATQSWIIEVDKPSTVDSVHDEILHRDPAAKFTSIWKDILLPGVVVTTKLSRYTLQNILGVTNVWQNKVIQWNPINPKRDEGSSETDGLQGGGNPWHG